MAQSFRFKMKGELHSENNATFPLADSSKVIWHQASWSCGGKWG